MRKQKLLENNSPRFRHIISIFLFLISLHIIFSLIKINLLKFEQLELEILFSGIFTLIVEFFILLYLFFSYPLYFQSLLKKEFTGFFKGFLIYLTILPILSIIMFFSFFMFEKMNFYPIPQQIIFIYMKINSLPVIIFLFFLSTIIAPFFEEIFFRGFLYPAFKEKFSILFSILTTALIFSLFHNEIFIIMGIFILGCILTYAFEKTRNLWVCIGIHFLNNFLVTIFIIIYRFFYTPWK